MNESKRVSMSFVRVISIFVFGSICLLYQVCWYQVFKSIIGETESEVQVTTDFVEFT